MTVGSKRLLGCAALVLVALAASALAQHQGHEQRTPTPTSSPPTGSAAQGAARSQKVTMEELHRSGGVPLGWKFALPGGDPAKGRQVFVDLECYKCHAVHGENFPAAGGDAKNVGPELTGMGGQHPAEYFAESILTPNAVILEGPGYMGRDGKSIMPSYADSLSVAQLVDLVAFLRGLTGGGHMHAMAPAEQTTDVYTVRLDYRGGSEHAGHEGHSAGAAPGH